MNNIPIFHIILFWIWLSLPQVFEIRKCRWSRKDPCIDLGMITANFPYIGSCSPDTQARSAMAAGISVPGKCSNSGVLGPDDTPCSCPVRFWLRHLNKHLTRLPPRFDSEHYLVFIRMTFLLFQQSVQLASVYVWSCMKLVILHPSSTSLLD